MTFNIVKQEKADSITNANLVMESNIEVSDETYDLIEKNLFLRNVESIVKDIKEGNTASLEEMCKDLELNGTSSSFVHVMNILTFKLFDELKVHVQTEMGKENFENFEVPSVNVNNSLDYDYDEGDYDDEYPSDGLTEAERQVNKHKNYIEKLDKLTKSKQKDFLYEMEELRNKSTNVLKQVDLKQVTEVITQSISKLAEKKAIQTLMMGDKNALLQLVINLQKCAILKTSREEFTLIRDSFKKFSPIVVNNVSLQKQVFTGSGAQLPEEYVLLTRGLFNLNNGYYQPSNSMMKNSFISQQEKSESILDKLSYQTFSTNFNDLLLMNNYFSMNEGIVINYQNKNSVVNYDNQNIKNFISEFAKTTQVAAIDKIVDPNNLELFLISNMQIKTMIINAKKVDSKDFDLAFINNCSKLIANSLSISLYDFVFNDDVFSQIIDKNKLLKNITTTMLNGYFYDSIEEKNATIDLPKEFMIHIIEMFNQYLSYDEIEATLNSTVKESEEKQKKEEAKKNKKGNSVSSFFAGHEVSGSDMNKGLIYELINTTLRERKMLSKLSPKEDTQYIRKRKKL